VESLLSDIFWETVWVFYEASIYLLVGFFVAGLLHVYLPANLIARHLGRNDARSVGLAALFGAPIPLCSCGVLPAAASLKRQGAGRAPLVSFLISTPETGVDSVALTYGLMGPVMAVVRPVVAVVTALIAGIALFRFSDHVSVFRVWNGVRVRQICRHCPCRDGAWFLEPRRWMRGFSGPVRNPPGPDQGPPGRLSPAACRPA